MRRLAGALLLFAPLAALAQYSGPAVEACRAFAEAEEKKDGGTVTAVQFDKDRHLNLERVARKLGSQFVGSALFGNGAVLLASGPAVEMSFLCLLADERRPLYFHWTLRRDAPVLAQCRRTSAAGPDLGKCFSSLLELADQDLLPLYAQGFQAARDADAAAGNENASKAFRRSNDAWRAYREAECARRGPPGSDALRACMVELTRRRALDLR
jgi:uncharacterized protein YecT (DUF1311 family)